MQKTKKEELLRQQEDKTIGEKVPFGDKMKIKGEPLFLSTTAHAIETAAIKADTQRSGHFSGFSRNISRHLGSDGLQIFCVRNPFAGLQTLYVYLSTSRPIAEKARPRK